MLHYTIDNLIGVRFCAVGLWKLFWAVYFTGICELHW